VTSKQQRLSLTLCLLAISGLAAGRAAADTLTTKSWVVTSAKATGAGGEQFVTSLRLVNPYNTTANVSLTFLPQSSLDSTNSALGDNSGRPASNLTVAAGATRAIDDVVGTLFGSAAPAGGIRINSDIPISVFSQTLVANARSATGVAGTYGFAIPSQVDDQAISVGDTAFVPYVTSTPDGATSGYRTNLFLLSTFTGGNSVVNVQLVKGDGSSIGNKQITLGKGSQTQINRIGSFFGYTQADNNLTAVINVLSGGPVVVGASVIDNAISSIAYTPPVKIFQANNGAFGLIFIDDVYGFSWRLDIQSGVPNFLTAGIVNDKCSQPTLFFIQAFTSGTNQNTTFTKNTDGSFTFSGQTSSSRWTGTVNFYPDGTIYGTVTFTPTTGTCAGNAKTLNYTGARGAVLPPL